MMSCDQLVAKYGKTVEENAYANLFSALKLSILESKRLLFQEYSVIYLFFCHFQKKKKTCELVLANTLGGLSCLHFTHSYQKSHTVHL